MAAGLLAVEASGGRGDGVQLPVTTMPSKVSSQPIDVTEVADRLVAIAARPAAHRVPDIGGPEVRDGADLARSYLPSLTAPEAGPLRSPVSARPGPAGPGGNHIITTRP
jgi:hypothetical protein